jgi:hypothetical protein
VGDPAGLGTRREHTHAPVTVHQRALRRGCHQLVGGLDAAAAAAGAPGGCGESVGQGHGSRSTSRWHDTGGAVGLGGDGNTRGGGGALASNGSLTLQLRWGKKGSWPIMD